MFKKVKKTITVKILSAIVISAVALVSCGRVVVEDAQDITFAVGGYQVSKTSLDDYLDFGGDVVAASSVDILPDASGKLSRIYVSVGDYVRRDALLAEVDSSRPGMTYNASPINAPISGTISSFPLAVGSTVAPSMSVGKISSTGELEIQAAVAERFVSRVDIGQKAELRLDAWPGEVFMATITEVSPVLDPTTRTMAVKLIPEDVSGEKIKPGMYTRIKLITEEKEDVFVIPHYALITREDEPYVFVVQEDETVRLQKIVVGLRVDDSVEVTEGLAEGEIVVTRGQTLLDEGMKVSVVSVETDGVVNTENEGGE